ncbi:MAG: hypothetical protein IJ607_06225 [Bacteroidaceae bacterium]|nr:hypothetical protein [Bacteroidaceae bacterium]
MKKFYSAPQTKTISFQVRYSLMEETAQEVLAKQRKEEEAEQMEEEEFLEFVASMEERKPLW